jgi:hypothetical protein
VGGRARFEGANLMLNPSEEFRKYAADCNRMAKLSRDKQDRTAWNQLAERWIVCAVQAESRYPPAHLQARESAKRHRRAAHSWSH